MEHGFSIASVIILTLLILVIFGVKITAPEVTKTVTDLKSSSVTVIQTPLVGCSLSRARFEVLWQ